MSNENTIDTLVINIKGDDSASRTLDRVLKKLEQIKKSAKGGHFGSFNKQLSSLKSKVDGMFKGVNKKSVSSPQLEKLKAQADQSVKRIEGLTKRIHEMNTSFSDKPTSVMQKLIDKENELEATARRVKSQITSTTPQPLADKYNSQYADLRGQIEQVSNKQLDLVDNGRAFLTVAQTQPQAFDKLNDQLHQEEDHLDELRKKFDDISEKSVPRLSDRVKAFGGQVKTAFSESVVGKFGNKLHQTISRIGKMALYRIMRTMMKQVTEAFKTGMDDMYQYSKGFNGEYARSMDQLASANLSYKNSIGAIMAPIMNLVVPWLDKVVDKLMDINNTAAMVIAGLSGKSTYSKAVRVTTEYAAAASKAEKNTGKVTEKVKELRKSLAGLDEITIIGDLADPTSTSRSIKDSAGESTPDYSSMFIEAPVDMAKVREIKEKLDQILQVAKWIGIAIGAWELVKFLSSIGQAISGLGLLGRTLGGLTLMIAGFGIEFSGAFDIGKNGLNLKNALMTALGAALGVAGSLLVFGTGPVGWTVGLTVALTVGVVGYIMGGIEAGKELYRMSEDYRQLEALSEKAKTQAERAKVAFDNLQQAKEKATEVLFTGGVALNLIDEIFDLAEKTNRSNDELSLLKSKIEVLNDLGLDGLKLEFDSSTNSIVQIKTNADGATERIKATRGEIEKLTESLIKQAQTEALLEVLKESYKSFYTASSQQAAIQDEVTESQNRLGQAAKDYTDFLKSHTDIELIANHQKLGELAGKVEEAKEAYNEAKNAQELNNKTLKASSRQISTTETDLKNLKNGTYDLAGAFDKLGISVPKAIDKTKTSVKSSLDNLLNPLIERVETFGNRWRQSFNDIFDDIAEGLKNADFRADGTYSYNYLPKRTVPRFAQGGFPEDGLFYANHNEIIGQFSNGKTAVANNEQIVEGIAEGVASANDETNSLLRRLIGVGQLLLEKDSTINVSDITKAMDRKNRRDGKVTVPVSI